MTDSPEDERQITLQKVTSATPHQNDGAPIRAQFNPASLQYTITNATPSGSGNQRSREVPDSVGKLTFDLVFDSSDTGADVRLKTQEIARLMQPEARRKAPLVRVSWGAFVFEGALDQYRETLDYFAAEGVPLRATLSLGFSTVGENNATPSIVFTFAGLKAVTSSVSGQASGASDTETVAVPVGGGARPGGAPGAAGGGQSATDVASRLGDAGLARSIGAANGLEDIRNPLLGGGTLEVSGEVVLDGPIAFSAGGGAAFGAAAGFGASAGAGFGASASAGFGASASAGFGASASAGFGASASAGFGASASAGFGASASAGFGAGASAGFGASASAGFGASASAGSGASASAGFGAGASASGGISVQGGVATRATGVAFGGSAFSASAGGSSSAGVSASSGAFARLGPRPSPARRPPDLSRAFQPPPTAIAAVTEHVEVGGRVRVDVGSGFVADVGQRSSLQARLQFEED